MSAVPDRAVGPPPRALIDDLRDRLRCKRRDRDACRRAARAARAAGHTELARRRAAWARDHDRQALALARQLRRLERGCER